MSETARKLDSLFIDQPPILATYIRNLFDKGETFSITTSEISAATAIEKSLVIVLLEQLAATGLVTRYEYFKCDKCEYESNLTELDSQDCSTCGEPLLPNERERIIRFVSKGARRRSIRWVVTIHGMNTRGQWQQEYAWLLAKANGYAIPVFVYKYGRILISPLLMLRQQKYARLLSANLRSRIKEMTRESKYGDRPDILAHSFGTWLIANVLSNDSTINVGRIVLTGSIIPPNFNWATLINRGQVEAVLCHSGGYDLPVRLSPYFIPNAGPSGYIGFNDRSNVQHVHTKAFAHSDYFKAESLKKIMGEIWGDFLTTQDPMIWVPRSGSDDPVSREWSRSWKHRLGFTLKIAIIAALTAVIILALLSIIVGTYSIFS